MSLYIVRDDITNLKVDAIVNAANERLWEGGGVCGRIFEVAGKNDLSAACRKIGYCETGDAVLTSGFKLPAKYVIHAVGPIYRNGKFKEDIILKKTYMSALNLAKSKDIKSIAFPLISAGIFAYPKGEAIEIALRSIKEFLSQNDMEVFLVLFDRETFEIAEKIYNKINGL
ncbi:MAG: macro domain-containing protein [Tissierellia bacterium]|nr:macro domain-containing protein [Tissierellia bacterium]